MVAEKSGIILILDPQLTRIFFNFLSRFLFYLSFLEMFDSTRSVWCSMTYVGLRLVCDNHQGEFLAIVTFVPCFYLAIFSLVFPAGIYDTFVPCGILHLSFSCFSVPLAVFSTPEVLFSVVTSPPRRLSGTLCIPIRMPLSLSFQL